RVNVVARLFWAIAVADQASLSSTAAGSFDQDFTSAVVRLKASLARSSCSVFDANPTYPKNLLVARSPSISRLIELDRANHPAAVSLSYVIAALDRPPNVLDTKLTLPSKLFRNVAGSPPQIEHPASDGLADVEKSNGDRPVGSIKRIGLLRL